MGSGPVERDAAILQAALAALRSSGYPVMWQLRCEVQGGVVAVSGLVPSYHLKQMAQAVLLRLKQARTVLNLVDVHRETTGAAGSEEYPGEPALDVLSSCCD